MVDKRVKEASLDYRYLINRGYKKKVALAFVGGHYRLSTQERNFILRSVFSDSEIAAHKKRKVDVSEIKNQKLVVDGYNVLIGTWAALSGKAIRSDDGFVRDCVGYFGNYSLGIRSKTALSRILKVLKQNEPKFVLFLFDSQVSRSGELAEFVREELDRNAIMGHARTSKRVDYDIKEMGWITASSDSAIIEKVDRVVDLVAESAGEP